MRRQQVAPERTNSFPNSQSRRANTEDLADNFLTLDLISLCQSLMYILGKLLYF